MPRSEGLYRRRGIKFDPSQPMPSEDIGHEAPGHERLILLPILAVLCAAAVLVAEHAVDVHHPEVDAVAERDPREDVAGAGAGQRPAQAHRHVADVVEVASEGPPAGGEEVAALLGVDVLHGLAPDLVLREVAALRDVRPEVVLLDVAHAEDPHAEDVDAGAGEELEVVVVQRLPQEGHVAAEGEAVEPAQEAEVAVGQHPAEEVVADVRGREVGRLVPVVVEDVVPVRDTNHHRPHADLAPVAGRAAHRAVALHVAAEVHGGDVRLVADDPQGEARPGVPEALEVERHRQEAVEEARVTRDAHPPVVDHLAVAEDAPVLLELRVIDVAPPEDAEVDVQPGGHRGGGDDAAGQQGAHVGPDVVRTEEAEPAQAVDRDVREEVADQPVHRVLQPIPVLQHDALVDLGRDEDLHGRLEDHPDRDGVHRRPRRTDGEAVGQVVAEAVPELGVREHHVSLVHDHASVKVPDAGRDEEGPAQASPVAAELPDGAALSPLDPRGGLLVDDHLRSESCGPLLRGPSGGWPARRRRCRARG
mmetsp:Transcript_59101/g.155647  ORF Transcript_59101/g.155647 Transcript_59101/m.155647 type:complete len:533 (-) Transcript_59101:20-1618(-)